MIIKNLFPIFWQLLSQNNLGSFVQHYLRKVIAFRSSEGKSVGA